MVVIGAGQAGLSSAYFLRERGVHAVVLDANRAPGGAWQHRWDSLRLSTVHRIAPLPGLPFDGGREDAPASAVVGDYFARYKRSFDLRVPRPVTVGGPPAARRAAAGRVRRGQLDRAR